MNRVSMKPGELIRGDDGETYHLPTLRALFAAGRLPVDSAGYRALVASGTQDRGRLLA